MQEKNERIISAWSHLITCKENLDGNDWVDNVPMSSRFQSINMHYDMHGDGIILIWLLHGL